MPSAGWSTGRLCVIQMELEGLTSSGAVGSSLRPEAQGPGVPEDVIGQEKTDVFAQADRASLPFLCLFVQFRPSTDWVMPTCTGEVVLRVQMLISSRDSLTDVPSNNVLPAVWAPLQTDT